MRPIDSIAEVKPEESLPKELSPGPAYSSGNYTDENTSEGHYDPNYAFDGNKSTLWHSPLPGGTLGWIAQKFNKPAMLSMFTISIRTDQSDQAPLEILLTASNDGKNWVNIGFIEGIHWEKGESKTFAIKKTGIYYTHYKFNFLASQGNAFVSILDMGLFGDLKND